MSFGLKGFSRHGTNIDNEHDVHSRIFNTMPLLLLRRIACTLRIDYHMGSEGKPTGECDTDGQDRHKGCVKDWKLPFYLGRIYRYCKHRPDASVLRRHCLQSADAASIPTSRFNFAHPHAH